MGRFFPNSGLKTSVEVIVMVLIATIIMSVVYYLSPGLQAQGSKILNSISVDDSNIDNKCYLFQVKKYQTKFLLNNK